MKILSLEVFCPELQLDPVVAHLTGVHHALAKVQRDLLRRPEGQYHGLGRLGHRVWLDHHSFARQLPCIFGKYGNAREAEDQRQDVCPKHRSRSQSNSWPAWCKPAWAKSHILSAYHQHADPPHSVALLRARRERPRCRRAAKQRDDSRGLTRSPRPRGPAERWAYKG